MNGFKAEAVGGPHDGGVIERHSAPHDGDLCYWHETERVYIYVFRRKDYRWLYCGQHVECKGK